MNKTLLEYIKNAENSFFQIPDKRKSELEEIAAFVTKKNQLGEKSKLIYICTHNSRRSHFGQIWAATAAAYYAIHNLESYSGGTESTAFNERSVAAVKRAGFEVLKTTEGTNPIYYVKYDENGKEIVAFSKKFDDEVNPQNDFCAIMTCSSADKACPVVFGAGLRVATQYEDPKAFDDTAHEAKMYDERCKQIATETLYLFSKVIKE
ncbi:MAG: protein-tyrosine-phosphatase [Cytophagaceae bacterium BCCC1]|nr:MAG: protein-tyrosine-phosphatase [Cytophagaceae bacterium BCCC1]